jgi:hypothetical protein
MLAWIEGVFGHPISASLPIFNQSVVIAREQFSSRRRRASRGRQRSPYVRPEIANQCDRKRCASPLPSATALKRCGRIIFSNLLNFNWPHKNCVTSVELIPSRVALTKRFSILNRLTIFTIQSAASAISRDEGADGRFFPAIQSHGVYTNARHTISIGNKGWRGGPSNSGETSKAAPTYASHRGSGRFRAMTIA